MRKCFVFESNGKQFSVYGPDADRARIIAKRMAGSDWSGKTKLVEIKMGGAK